MNTQPLLFFFLLFAVTTEAQVKVLFKNDTGKRIDSLKVENVYVGTLEKGAAKALTFDRIVCEKKEPIFRLSANIGNEKFQRGDEAFQCATFLTTVSEGEYTRNITLFPIGNGKNLLLFKKE
jgi:hypothetical protein